MKDVAYCRARITCELGSIPTVGIGGQIVWFLVCEENIALTHHPVLTNGEIDDNRVQVKDVEAERLRFSG